MFLETEDGLKFSFFAVESYLFDVGMKPEHKATNHAGELDVLR